MEREAQNNMLKEYQLKVQNLMELIKEQKIMLNQYKVVVNSKMEAIQKENAEAIQILEKKQKSTFKRSRC